MPPRGTIDLVVSDDVDYVNGYATPFPATASSSPHPPVNASGLRNYADWNSLVITHELTHISTSIDRAEEQDQQSRRNPLLFPNSYEPSWVVEGHRVFFFF